MKRANCQIVRIVLPVCCFTSAYAAASVQPIAWYRLGDDDPGAAPGRLGNTYTLDHTLNHLDLLRDGGPRYSADVPLNSVASDKLSMSFLNFTGPLEIPQPGPSYYSRVQSTPSPGSAYALECWVKSSWLGQGDPSGYGLIAYNGTPFYNGIGFFQHGKNYVVRIGAYEKVLAPASSSTWTHLAFARRNTTNGFYVNGLEQSDSSSSAQAAPILAGGGFYVAGFGNPLSLSPLPPRYLFNGLVDEARFFSYPTVTTSPTADFLISNVPRDLGWSGAAGSAWNSSANWMDNGSSATWSNLAPDNARFGAGSTVSSVAISAPMTVGSITFDAAGPVYTLAGNTLTLDGLLGQGLSAGRSVNINAPVVLNNDQQWDVAAGQTVSVNNAITGLGLAKSGAGTVAVNALSNESVTVNAGTVRVAQVGGTMRVNALSVASGARLDLSDNDLVVNDGDFGTIKMKVLEGYGATTGITSATGDGMHMLALFDNAQVGATQWAGETVGASAVIGKYTYFGDVNLDGQVTGDDYTIIDSNLNTMPTAGLAWLSGDANLDGVVSGDDYTTIDSNLGAGGAGAVTPSALAPEPFGVSVLSLLGSMALCGRRRKPATAGEIRR